MRTAIIFLVIIGIIVVWIFFMGSTDPFDKKDSLMDKSLYGPESE